MSANVAPDHVVGPLGSDFYRIQVPGHFVERLAPHIDRLDLGRKLMLDATRGIITWMNPSPTHEGLVNAADRIVTKLGELWQLDVANHRGSRWRGPDNRRQPEAEPDEAFYIGAKVQAWMVAEDESMLAGEAFVAANPPDLVVEVEVTHWDADKWRFWAEIGVVELWSVKANRQTSTLQLDIRDLTGAAVHDRHESRFFPGVSLAVLNQAFDLARRKRFAAMADVLQAMVKPIRSHTAPSTDPGQ